MSAPSVPLAELLTTIITTSPSPVHPSSELIMQVIDSMDHHAPSLAGCRTIIVCDGCNVHAKCKYRSGMVDPAALERYHEYKRRLRHALATRPSTGREPISGAPPASPALPAPAPLHGLPQPFASGLTPSSTDLSVEDWTCVHCSNCNWQRRRECKRCLTPRDVPIPERVGGRFELLELPSRNGFGHAVRAALERVTTPLVCVVQHDRTMMRAVDLEAVAQHVHASDGEVGYVLLLTLTPTLTLTLTLEP